MDQNKKIDRKKKRFVARLKSSKGIDSTEVVGLNIVLCNVGQATGFEKSNVQKLITDNNITIQCPKFIAEKGESYSFLIFNSVEDASVFYKALDGKVKVDDNGALLYMSYVDYVPNTEIICPHEDPKGLTILENFITLNEEQRFIDQFDWTTDSNLKNRQVKHYGYEFRYGSNDVDLTSPLSEKIPVECDVLWQRLKEQGYDLGVPDQLTVNKYVPGQVSKLWWDSECAAAIMARRKAEKDYNKAMTKANFRTYEKIAAETKRLLSKKKQEGIPIHVDRHSPFGATILSVSLGSGVVMDWKHHSGKHVPIVVPARSMLIMQDEARYDWQHGIQPRTHDPIIEYREIDNKLTKVITSDTIPRQMRISLTFRWTRRGPCDCIYKTLCDTVENELDDKLAANLEELHVHQVYEQIASHFSVTRHSAWPAVVQFMQHAASGATVLDLGAGNGKNILHRNDIFQIACERSSGLLAEIDRTRADRVRVDMLQCSVRDNCADRIICIAVIHHFSTKARRLQALSEIHRVLAPSGVALITVWAKDQTKSNYLLKSKLNQTTENIQMKVAGVNLHVHENRTQFQHQDLLVPWKLRRKNDNKENKLEDRPDSTLLRYYHVFEEGELEDLCKEVGLVVERSFYEEGNWCVECKKI